MRWLPRLFYLISLHINEKIFYFHIHSQNGYWDAFSSAISFPVLTLNFQINVYLNRTPATSVALFRNNFPLLFTNLWSGCGAFSKYHELTLSSTSDNSFMTILQSFLCNSPDRYLETWYIPQDTYKVPMHCDKHLRKCWWGKRELLANTLTVVFCCLFVVLFFFLNVLVLCVSIPVLLSCFFEFLFLCWQWSTYEKKLEWQAVSHNRISLLYTKLICIHRTSGSWQEYFWFWVGFEYILSKQSSSCLIRFYFTYPSEKDFK